MSSFCTSFKNKIVTLVLILTFLVPVYTIKPEEADASGPLTGGATEWTQLANNSILGVSATANTATAANMTSILFKETVLDGIAWAIAKETVSSMTRSLINWVNSGFQGDPMFVTDLRQHLTTVLDNMAGDYIANVVGDFVCSPFALDVQVALTLNYANARNNVPNTPDAALCSLTDITENIEGFLSGTINNMDDLITVINNPQNTPLGAYFEAEARLNVALQNAAGQEIKLLEFGDGFLSQQQCYEDGRCEVVTPGQVISEALTFQLQTGTQSLIEADEINELIGALMNQLVLAVTRGAGGLLGLSTPASGSSSSYLDNMVAESSSLTTNQVNLDKTIAQQIALEQQYKALADRVLASSTEILIDINSKIATQQELSGATTTLSVTELFEGVDQTIVNSVGRQLTTVINDAILASSSATANIVTLNDMLQDYLRATNSTAQTTIISKYQTLAASGRLVTDLTIQTKQQYWDDQLRQIQSLIDS